MQGVSKELAVSLLFDKQRGILSILKNTRKSLSPKAKQLMLGFFVDLIRRQFVTTALANEMQAIQGRSACIMFQNGSCVSVRTHECLKSVPADCGIFENGTQLYMWRANRKGESWRAKTESKMMLKAYEKILPSFHDYLILDFADDEGIVASNSTKTAAKRSFGRRKNLKDNLHLDEETVETLKGIQIRILKFLGSLGDANKLMLSSDTSDSLLAWDSERCLKFQIQFKGTIVDMYFDDLLPRIVKLAEFRPIAKIKVAANELCTRW
ncbi:hypothetical protein HDU77_001468 [Chytriomyces hyalinus]|nr:hypothetical protein HDU77_001468 [Chytriomyces hyalinus]